MITTIILKLKATVSYLAYLQRLRLINKLVQTGDSKRVVYYDHTDAVDRSGEKTEVAIQRIQETHLRTLKKLDDKLDKDLTAIEDVAARCTDELAALDAS